MLVEFKKLSFWLKKAYFSLKKGLSSARFLFRKKSQQKNRKLPAESTEPEVKPIVLIDHGERTELDLVQDIVQDLESWPKEDLQIGKEPAQILPIKPPASTEHPSIFEVIQEFSLVQLSPHSQRAYANDLKDFFAYLKTLDIWESWSTELSPLHIAEYREFLLKHRKLAKSTITRKLAVLKSFCKWAVARGWMQKNPAELVRSFPQTQESKTGFLSDSELKKLLRSLPYELETPRLFRALTRVTVETLLMLGLRRSEAASIHLNDIEYNDETWLLRVHGKGNKDRLLPLPPRLQSTWSQWLQRVVPDTAPFREMEDEPLEWLKFFKAHRERALLISTRATNFETAITPGEIGHIVRKAGFFAKLPKRLSPHMLRATAITHALDQGASHRGIQQMAGWTSPLMITRYDKRKNDPKFSAVHQLLYAKEWAFLDDDEEDDAEGTQQDSTASSEIAPENPFY